jgi:DNA-binding transcriptional regulator YiaG
MERSTTDKVILLNQDIKNIYFSKGSYTVEEIANLYSIRSGVIRYIHNLTEQEVDRSTSVVTDKHRYKYVLNFEEDTPKPKPKKESKPKKKAGYKRKDPADYNYRKSAVPEDKIRYIRENPDGLSLKQMAEILKITKGCLDGIRYKYVAKKVTQEGPIYQPTQEELQLVKEKFPRHPNNVQRIFFTKEEIQEMRNSGLSLRALAEKYGVSAKTIERNMKGNGIGINMLNKLT